VAGGDFRIISEAEAVDRIADTVVAADERSAPFVFVVGAGLSSGLVPTVQEMLQDHVPMQARASRGGGVSFADLLAKPATERAQIAGGFWREFVQKNEKDLTQFGLMFELSDAGLPRDSEQGARAYQAAFDHRLSGALNEPKQARDFLRQIMRLDQPRLNTAHFFLASLLGELRVLRDDRHEDGTYRSPFKPGVALSRLILTTNFDPFLQTALQFVGRPYYVSDRPELEIDDGQLGTGVDVVHLIYVHGSIHRRSQVSNETDIQTIKKRNAQLLRNVLRTHGVIVVGYRGWDDAIVEALAEAGGFDYRLYWCGLEPDPGQPPTAFGRQVPQILRNPLASYVRIQDAGGFMFRLCRRLVGWPRLVKDPIGELRDRLDSVDLAKVAAAEPGPAAIQAASTMSAAGTIEQVLAQTRAELKRAAQAWTPPAVLGQGPTGATASAATFAPASITSLDNALVVRPGDSLAEAVRDAPRGARILIHPGTYEASLVLDRELDIVGLGEPEVIRIEATNASTLAFRAPRGRVTNVTLRQRGSHQDSAWVAVDVGEGALILEHCWIKADGMAGIAVRGAGTAPEIRGNRVYECRQSGVLFLGEARGTLEGNFISHHRQHGVLIRGRASPTLLRNQIHHNGRVGVHLEDAALGLLEENEIFANTLEGVTICQHSDPRLERNRIYENTKAGVYVFDAGKGTLEGNVIRSNNNSGVAIRRDGAPAVRRNQITLNNGKGVWCSDRAAGLVEDNDLRDNRFGASWKSDDSTTRFIDNRG
jgi:parallel beta-helix repeat protein